MKCHFYLLIGVSGVNCEEHSYGFQELSYIVFPPLDPHYNFISLEFASVQENSLLLYNNGDPSNSEFLGLEIVDGRLWFSYDLGSGVVRLVTGKFVADGRFHNITVKRSGNVCCTYIFDIKSFFMKDYFAGVHPSVSLR